MIKTIKYRTVPGNNGNKAIGYHIYRACSLVFYQGSQTFMFNIHCSTEQCCQIEIWKHSWIRNMKCKMKEIWGINEIYLLQFFCVFFLQIWITVHCLLHNHSNVGVKETPWINIQMKEHTLKDSVLRLTGSITRSKKGRKTKKLKYCKIFIISTIRYLIQIFIWLK